MGKVTELKKWVPQSLKTWVNTFQNTIDNGVCPVLNAGLKWFSAAVDGMLVSSPSCGMAIVSLLKSLMLSPL